MKGLSNKQHKIVMASAEFIKESLRYIRQYLITTKLRPVAKIVHKNFIINYFCRSFGSKVIPIKSVLKVLPKILEHSDKGVREEVYQYIEPTCHTYCAIFLVAIYLIYILLHLFLII